jgi:hypothetical protein
MALISHFRHFLSHSIWGKFILHTLGLQSDHFKLPGWFVFLLQPPIMYLTKNRQILSQAICALSINEPARHIAAKRRLI